MAPKDTHVPVNDTRKPVNAAFYVQKNFTGVIKLMIMRRGDYAGFSGWALNLSVLIRGKHREI